MTALAEIFTRSAPFVRHDVPLAPFTSFGIGGPAQFYAEPENAAQVQLLRRIFGDYGCPVRVMGAGTNLLVDDRGADGLVMRTCRMNRVERDGCRVRSGVGATISSLIRGSLRWELGGLAELAGIPGTVGGAVATNAGTSHGSIGPFVETVTGVDADGCMATVDGSRLEMGYRSARLDGMIVCDVTLALNRRSESDTRGLMRQWLGERKATQPLRERSAGCIFKNPPGIGAGRLIDQLGLKGTRCGDAEVSRRHANFIINRGRATAADVLGLMQSIQRIVREEKGIELEPEIEIWERSNKEGDHGF